MLSATIHRWKRKIKLNAKRVQHSKKTKWKLHFAFPHLLARHGPSGLYFKLAWHGYGGTGWETNPCGRVAVALGGLMSIAFVADHRSMHLRSNNIPSVSSTVRFLGLPPPYPQTAADLIRFVQQLSDVAADPWDIRERNSPSIIIHLTRLLLCPGSIDRGPPAISWLFAPVVAIKRLQSRGVVGGGIVKTTIICPSKGELSSSSFFCASLINLGNMDWNGNVLSSIQNFCCR